MLVVRSVRFSRRPCPLSLRLANCVAGTASGSPSGGKSRGQPPRLLLIGQPGGYVVGQRRLVVLDGQDVIAAAGDDLGAEVALAEEGVASDDAAPQRQDAQQLQSGLVLVGLGI